MPAMILAMLPLGSCSILNKKINNKEEVKKEAVLPTDREKIVQPVSAVYSYDELAKGVVKGDWAIEKVNGKSSQSSES